MLDPWDSIGKSAELENVWADDIIRRCGGIDRLLAIASEFPHVEHRVASILSLYIRELSKDHKPSEAPAGGYEKLHDWALSLSPPNRSDIEAAARALGSLPNASKLRINLAGSNFQGCDLSGLTFRNVDFSNAHLDGANLSSSDFSGAGFGRAFLDGASLISTNLTKSWLHNTQARAAEFHFTKLDETSIIGGDYSFSLFYGKGIHGVIHFESAMIYGCAFKEVDLRQPNLMFTDGNVVFTDASAKKKIAENLPIANLQAWEFREEWEYWLKSPDNYIPPHLRNT